MRRGRQVLVPRARLKKNTKTASRPGVAARPAPDSRGAAMEGAFADPRVFFHLAVRLRTQSPDPPYAGVKSFQSVGPDGSAIRGRTL